MTFQQVSQRAKGYLKTAETLLRAAQTMTDRAIAGQLKALADDYQRQAEKASPHGFAGSGPAAPTIPLQAGCDAEASKAGKF
jgi:hypothetical protein